MTAAPETSINEVDFCAQIASAANILFSQNPEAFPFCEARVEGYGTGDASRKRKDLRFFEPSGKLALCGEVKLPGTADGHSPYDNKLCQDAAKKADDAHLRFFFTWNVNVFVLWDRSQWDKPFLERRVREWKLGINLANRQEVARPENLKFIRERFLPDLLRDLADIYTGRRRDWSMPPDDIFIRSLESHLDWPVQLTTAYLIVRTDSDRKFDEAVQRWLAAQDWLFVRNVPGEWYQAMNNMAKTLAYVWANRLIFYKALRARFSDLPRLELRASVKTEADATRAFNGFFERAVERSGDYEPLLFPNAKDWAAPLVFEAPNALDAWRGLLRGIEAVDFKDVPSDIVGRIFQKLIGPEERHRYGQHFTGDDAVDLTNAFCIRDGADKVLDPACGSGSFLVRAYYRKRYLDPSREHLQHLADLFGCDISLYPAHLATLNLAAREINEEANYPRIVRRDFFDTERRGAFCTIPDNAGGSLSVQLPELDAVVGNPPYVRQEKVGKRDKTRYSAAATSAWDGLQLSGRADLHCYFWPVAAKLLKSDGFFGFLTSSSWLDVEYGFALQGWVLRHFKLLAVMESAAEPWFTDARVKTAITVLQRCEDETERRANLVRFVRFDKPLKDIIGAAAGGDEGDRQRAVERLRDRILQVPADEHDDGLRIIVKKQADLWSDGIRAGSILRSTEVVEAPSEEEDSEENENGETAEPAPVWTHAETYRAGKWGRYVRAPDFYFDIMRRFTNQFVMLGEIATVRYGVKTGCDAFFTPKDITAEMLAQHETDRVFRQQCGGAPRKDVASGKLKIIEAGDGSVHPIEAKYVRPEVHSVMSVTRPLIRATDLDRVVLLVNSPMDTLKTKAPWTWNYLKYGAAATFASRKSKAVPVPKRSFISKRPMWYDLTDQVKPGTAIWPKGQQYRHLVISNPDSLVANCRLYDIAAKSPELAPDVLVAVLNGTLVAFWRNFYGRYTGTEGAMETMVIDALMTEVPNPALASKKVAARLRRAFKALCTRDTRDLVEEQLMECHSSERARRLAAGPLVLPAELEQADRRALDDAVFELLGVGDAVERADLVRRLHEATALHFRHIRVVEIEKQEQRGRTATRRFTVQDMAGDAWDAAELKDAQPLKEWLFQLPECTEGVNIPDERPARLSASPMFEPNTVYFGSKGTVHVECRSVEEAKLVELVANIGISGMASLPAGDAACRRLQVEVSSRLQQARAKFIPLADSRTSDPNLQSQIVEQLTRWFVLGRHVDKQAGRIPSDESEGA